VTITHINTSAAVGANTGNITLNAPAGPTIGDIWLAYVMNAADPTATNMTMSGDWTEIFEGSAETQSRIGVWWHRYAGVTPSMLVTCTDGGGGGRQGRVAAFSGCKLIGTPVQVTGAANGDDSASVIHLGITPVVANAAIIAVSGVEQDITYTTPTNYTVTGTFAGVFTGNDVAGAMFHRLNQPASATGNITAAISGANHWTSILFALEEEPVAVSVFIISMDEDLA